MANTSRTKQDTKAEFEHQAGATCAPQTGIAVADLVAELRDAASIVEGAGHLELADKLRNWAICVADVVTTNRSREHGSEVYVG